MTVDPKKLSERELELVTRKLVQVGGCHVMLHSHWHCHDYLGHGHVMFWPRVWTFLGFSLAVSCCQR